MRGAKFKNLRPRFVINSCRLGCSRVSCIAQRTTATFWWRLRRCQGTPDWPVGRSSIHTFCSPRISPSAAALVPLTKATATADSCRLCCSLAFCIDRRTPATFSWTPRPGRGTPGWPAGRSSIHTFCNPRSSAAEFPRFQIAAASEEAAALPYCRAEQYPLA